MASGVLNDDLAVALSLPVLLIVPDRSGVLNPALLAVEAIKNRGLTIATVILNQVIPNIDPHMNNAPEHSRWLGELVLTTDYCKADDPKSSWLLPCPLLTIFVDRLTGGL